MTTLILFARLFLAVHPTPVAAPVDRAAPAHSHLKRDVLVLDMSGPAEAESEFPTISAKGRL